VQQITLKRHAWRYDERAPLGKPGGFGSVYAGVDSEGAEVAVKRLHLTASAAAHRELRIADDLIGRTSSHVMPILDAGLDSASGNYFVVMPRAQSSLADELEDRNTLPLQEAIAVLRDILIGLDEVPSLVHRDLKPANVLKLAGAWRIADFGIARFVEETTSLQTLRSCLTPQYAAPEQWLEERANSATDLYAVGCIAHSLLRGSPPFAASTLDELRALHLRAAPPVLSSGSARLDKLVSTLLRKEPEVRPSRKRTLEGLEAALDEAVTPVQGAKGRLLEIGAQEAQRLAADEAAERSAASVQRWRSALVSHAAKAFTEMATQLLGRIADAIPTAKVVRSDYEYRASTPAASLSMTIERGSLPPAALQRAGWEALRQGEINVRQLGAKPYRWSASLFFMRKVRSDDFRWYEVSFYPTFGSASDVPMALDPEHAVAAMSPGITTFQVAFGPVPVDDEAFESFEERWLEVFARACEGRLEHPRHLPLG
jgi:eukaryotic-like serine/threonine-protein kinase